MVLVSLIWQLGHTSQKDQTYLLGVPTVSLTHVTGVAVAVPLDDGGPDGLLHDHHSGRLVVLGRVGGLNRT